MHDITSQSIVSPPLAGQDSFVLGITKPDASNTGAGVVRAYPTTVINGNITLTAGQSLLDTIVHGKVICNGDNILIENCVVDGGSAMTSPAHVITTANSGTSTATRVKIRFTTVYTASPSIWSTGIGSKNYLAYRCDVYDTVDCFSSFNTAGIGLPVNVSIQGCYGHNMSAYQSGVSYQASDNTHNDVIQLQGGDGCEMIGNNFVANYSTVAGQGPQIGGDEWTSPNGLNSMAAIMINTNGAAGGPNTNMIVRDNWLDAGVYCVNGGGGQEGSGDFKRNRFGRHMTGAPNYYTLTFDATYTASCHEGTADANVYEAVGDALDNTEVIVRRNY